jgi:uncharacterized protein (DUF2237 family)
MSELNVLGTKLIKCCTAPMTGYRRDGLCSFYEDDPGVHTVCAQMTKQFLQFSYDMGNDLISPVPAYNFIGLRAGDKWCLCVSRWLEAYKAGEAPPVVLAATHHSVLEHISLEELKAYAIDGDLA